MCCSDLVNLELTGLCPLDAGSRPCATMHGPISSVFTKGQKVLKVAELEDRAVAVTGLRMRAGRCVMEGCLAA